MKYENLIKISFAIAMGVALVYLGVYFYRDGVADLNRQATEAFAEALKRELATKNIEGDSLRIRSDVDASAIGQMPQTVYMVTETGREEYKVTAEKHRTNVTEDAETRALHSWTLREDPIVPDSLNVIWRDALMELSLKGETALCIATTDGSGNIDSLMTADYNHFVSTPCLISCTLGYGCEIEITGFVDYPSWFVLIHYVLIYILLLSAVCVLVYFLIAYLVKMIFHPTVEIKEVIVNQLVRDVITPNVRIYKLTENTIFDADKKLLIKGNEAKDLALQRCAFLELLLNAEGYKLSDEAIMETLWPDHTSTANKLHQLVKRLREKLEIDSSIHLNRVAPYSYQLCFDVTPE